MKKSMFIRILSCVMVMCMLSGTMLMTACNNTPEVPETEPPADTTSAPETTAAPETTEAPLVLTEQTVALNKNTKGIKILGVRNLASDTAINADWSASGIEFTATCEGDMTFAVETNDKGAFFRAYIDGDPYMNGETPYFDITGKGEIVLKDIPNGTHTIRVIKVTGYTLAFAAFTSVKLTGIIAEEAPKDKELYIEFVGDSITCAWGTIGTFDGKYTSQDATLGYSYLLAEELDADYSLTALSGQGICCGTPGVPLGYRYACYGKDAKTEYDFARKANLIVVNIGTNDETKAINQTQFKNDFKAWVEYAKEKNGADCKFLAVTNMKNGSYRTIIEKVFEELGGETAGYYTYKAARSRNATASYHPSVEEHAAYVPELLDLCKKIIAAPISAPSVTEPVEPGVDVTGAIELPANTVVVDDDCDKDGDVIVFTFGGVKYKATVGKDAFYSPMDAQNAVTAGGTIFFLPGFYMENFQVQKDLTLLGPKAGISPNVKGANKTDDWTLNPERSKDEDEAILMSNLGLGVWNATVYSDCHKIVMDGFKFSQSFLLRQNTGNEGEVEIEMNNILISGSTITNNILFFFPYYPNDATNPDLYKRHLKMENVRVEGVTAQYLFRMGFETLEISGLYMDSKCTKGVVEKFATAAGVGTDKYVIKDSMFRNTNTTIFSINLRNDLAAPNWRLDHFGVDKKQIDIEISGCVFYGADLPSEHAPWIKINRDSAAAIVRIKDNVFVSNNTGSVIVTDEGSVEGEYFFATEISGNEVIGCADPYKFVAAKDAVLFVN